MKRLTSSIIAFLIILNSVALVFADNWSLSVSGTAYTGGEPLANWGDCIRLYGGYRVSYNVDFPEVGMYKLTAKAAEQVNDIVSTLSVSVDGTTVGSGEISSPTVTNVGSNRNWEDFDITTFFVSEPGTVVVELSMPKGNIALKSFDVILLAGESWSVSVNGLDYDSGTTLADWSDSIRLYTGNRVSYNLDFPLAGAYKLTAKAAEQVNDIVSTLSVSVDGTTVGSGEISSPTVTNVGSNRNWQNYDIATFFVSEPGTAVVELSMPAGNIALHSFCLSLVDEFAVEAENFTQASGILNITLSDSNSAVLMDAGDMIVFDAAVSMQGIYSISVVASGISDCTLSFADDNGGLIENAINVDAGWTEYQKTELGLCALERGYQSFELCVKGGEISIDKIIIEKGKNITLDVAQNDKYINGTLKNFEYEASNGKIIYALYDSQNNLKEYKVNADNTVVGASLKAELSHCFTNPLDGDYGRIYYWGGQDGLVPLTRVGQTEFTFKNTEPYMQIYVDEEGNDNDEGSIDAPFATIERALQEVAAFNDQMDGDIEICINPGTYYISDTIDITNEHSGKNGYRVIIRAADADSIPVVHGGVRVTGWTEGQNGIWSAPFDAVDEVRNLYIDGYAAQRARSSYLYKAGEYYSAEGSEYSDDGVSVSLDGFPQSFEHPGDLEAIWDIEWTSSHVPVNSVIYDSDSAKVVFDQPYYSYIRKESNTMVQKGKSFYLENDLSLLDERGEFYYDKHDNIIYYYPFEEEDLDRVYVSSTEGLLKIMGTADEAAQNITLRNIEFRYGAWNDVSTYGLRDTQADGMSINDVGAMMPAQLDVSFADGIHIEDLRISSMGSAALAMSNAVTSSSVTGCVITDCSATGIILGHWRHTSAMPDGYARCTDIKVTDNIIRRCGLEYKGSCGITAYYVKNTEISHNDLETLPYTGISLGWGWGRATELVPECSDNTIAYNKVTDVMNSLSDGGHIYTLGHLRNTSVYGNVLSGSGDYRGGIYTDNGSRYITIRDNIVKNSVNWLYTYDPTLTDILVYNNYSDTPQRYVNNSSGVKMEGNTLLDNSSKPAAIQASAGARAARDVLLSGLQYPVWRTNFIKTVPDNVYIAYPEGTIQAEDFSGGLPTQLTKTNITLYPSSYGDYVTYEVELSIGYYSIKTVGSLQQEYASAAEIYLDGSKVTECIAEPTGSWDKFGESSVGNFRVSSAGTHTLTIKMRQGYYMMDYIVLTKK